MATEKQLRHLQALEYKHQLLEQHVEESYQNFADDQYVAQLKLQKLKAKRDYLDYADSLDGTDRYPDDDHDR